MKFVADTNTVISGSLWDGAPAQFLSAALKGAAVLYFSPALLQELEDTLQRPKFAARLAAKNTSASSVVAAYRAASIEIAPAPINQPRELRDPDDSHVLACAVAAGVDAIVSGDNDLRVLGSFKAFRSFRPPKQSIC